MARLRRCLFLICSALAAVVYAEDPVQQIANVSWETLPYPKILQAISNTQTVRYQYNCGDALWTSSGYTQHAWRLSVTPETKYFDPVPTITQMVGASFVSRGSFQAWAIADYSLTLLCSTTIAGITYYYYNAGGSVAAPGPPAGTLYARQLVITLSAIGNTWEYRTVTSLSGYDPDPIFDLDAEREYIEVTYP